MIEGLKRGVHLFMPTGMHYIYTSIYRLFVVSQYDKSESLFHQILPVLAFSNQHLDISIHFFKQLLFKQSIYATPNVREPKLHFDKIHQKISEKHINQIIDLENKIKARLNA